MDLLERTRRPGGATLRLTMIMNAVLAIGVLAQGLFAGAFLQSRPGWFTAHEALGNALIIPALIASITALTLLVRGRAAATLLVRQAVLLGLIVAVIAAGHAGGAWLMLHIPAAIAALGIAVREVTLYGRRRPSPWQQR
ncbi:hypothetical protein FOE78_22535 [Microlunatus elymi]|uniref:Uncharacterized protein n=1 Tax=Microlunatus elymi TaxID=2596828 RepID=A0A516Q4H8_9ACTN|nr:hypothetical protein [Microlunatus elymi]QDP98314.1 hypothetical protein FOE78_22535 [Microlunatus elymi]